MPGIAEIVAGALFDFMGFLTSREEIISLGSSQDCQPLMEAFKAWCVEREFAYGDCDPGGWQLQMFGGTDSPNAVMSAFELELSGLINKHSMENASDTPDFILGAYLVGALCAFNSATNRRSEWYRPVGPPIEEAPLTPGV